ncbi:MAG TPA: hypothetical protein VIV82_06925 [Verrucomicrobiae bacterium]|jgi:hypothetical protein
MLGEVAGSKHVIKTDDIMEPRNRLAAKHTKYAEELMKTLL